MSGLEILDTGLVSRDDAAFPTLARLDNGDLLCAFNARGDGPNSTGGTDLARSTDGGTTWKLQGPILVPDGPGRANSLRLSRTSGGTLLAYGARWLDRGQDPRFGQEHNEPVLCHSEGFTSARIGCPLAVSTWTTSVPNSLDAWLW